MLESPMNVCSDFPLLYKKNSFDDDDDDEDKEHIDGVGLHL
jgi:hypothetical protein